ncbi:LysM peptidoglycan-binding domain-containing protein [Salmonella enterica subsp. enterica]|nr:LysM peptidoglycan-binding domain-containing protein [Salmonella enterica subsp. enterica serovar Bonn]EBZ5939350.1 LysM peptidoglycan-binding domain-containing protein [Salmonella enterica subsp. enterica serovar Muenchen]MLZ41093.1 LysM peptidoglycan-binding domain-containing protein [Salmonella enterica subsp. enterica serovar Bonn]
MLSSSLIRFFAQLNVALQIAFPLAGAFTPVIAAAQSDERFLKAPSSDLQTKLYTLASGETTSSVAKRYNMTLADLRKLNQFRTFSHNFDHLQPGDELEVPVSPLPKVIWVENPGNVDEKENEKAQKFAGIASQAGGFLSGRPGGDAAASVARGMVSDKASGELQHWLGKAGTARVQLNVDDNFSLKNSQLDLLVPLYEQSDRLIFTQGSMHRTDSRTQANLGAGFRHFYDRWMMGANTFFDYDLSRDHARSGVGLEYGRDFLKFAGNGYIPLTGWKESPDIRGYDERPARGWDVRAQAWVPSFPQLGGKLTYEQYYGKEVALFGKDNRQHNPRAVTAGITYTPVPLISLSAENRQGQSGKNDARFGLGLIWQPGVPWRQQLDPTEVAALRSLAGGRYDLVERNNNIILEYRKRNDLRLKTASIVSGYAGEEKSLGVSITSRYPLKQIEWNSAALEAAGGKIIQGTGSTYNVVLPAWQSSAPGLNSYTVSGVAIDSRGNRSNRSDTQVTVQTPLVNEQHSTFTPGESTIPADGKSTQVLTLSVRDIQNNPVDVGTDDITFNIIKHNETQVSTPVKTNAGVYEVNVTSGMANDSVKITPTVMGVSLSTATVSIIDIVPDSTKSTFKASAPSILADNTETVTLTFTANDANGHSITGIAGDITFAVQDANGSASSSGVNISTITESSPGVYTAQMKGTLAGSYTIVPHLNGNEVNSLKVQVILASGTIESTKSTLNASEAAIQADNVTTSVLTLMAKDVHGNIVPGISGNLSFVIKDDSGAIVTSGATISSINESSPGVYTATFRGTLVGSYTIVPQLSGVALGNLNVKVALTVGKTDSTRSAFVANQQTITADDVESITLTFTARDLHDNAITGLSNNLDFIISDDRNTVVNTGVVMSRISEIGTSGVYTAIMKGTLAGSYLVKPHENGSEIGNMSIAVTLTSGEVNGDQSTFTASQPSITADNTTSSILTFTARDLHSNSITGLGNNITFIVKDSSNATVTTGVTISSVSEVGVTGVYTAMMTGTLVGNYTLIPQVGGNPVGGVSTTVAITKKPELHLSTQIITNNAIADGTSENVIKVFLKDENGANVDTAVNVSMTAGDSQSVTYPSSIRLTNGAADLAIRSSEAGDYTFDFSVSTANANDNTSQSVKFSVDDTKARISVTADSGQLRAAYKENRNLTVTMTDGDGNAFLEDKDITLNISSDNGVVQLVKIDGSVVNSDITVRLPAGQTKHQFTFSSAIAGTYTISANYKTSKGSVITALSEVEATIEITGWKYKSTAGNGKIVNSNFRPTYIAQGDTAQVLLNDTSDYNSYYAFSLVGGNSAYSMSSDIVKLASVITNAGLVSASVNVVVMPKVTSSVQLTTSPVYALMAKSGVISTGSGNTWRTWGNNTTYCKGNGNDAVSMKQFQNYQNETGAVRTNNSNSLWTGTAAGGTQKAYFFAANGTFTAAGIYENKVSVCMLGI